MFWLSAGLSHRASTKKEFKRNGTFLTECYTCRLLREIFGEDMVFHLQRLLVDPLGANLRNKMAHGMMSFGEFFSISVAYLYWLILRLVCLPVIAYLRQQAADKASATASEAPEQSPATDKSTPSETE